MTGKRPAGAHEATPPTRVPASRVHSAGRDRAARRPVFADPGNWRTLLVAAGVYGLWTAALVSHRMVPGAVTVVLLAVAGAWHLSLVHELVHGHPFRRRAANEFLGSFPLTLWVPFRSFRILHLKHHVAELTSPDDDPESYYVSARRWASTGRVGRMWWWANRTMAFRLTVGMIVSTVAFVFADLGRALRSREFAVGWALHLCGAAVVVAALAVSGVGWCTVVAGILAARSLNMVRSFAEHLSLGDGGRTAQVHAGPLMSLLMLNNNLHVAHHDAPQLPWFRIPAHSARIGADELAAGGGGLYRGGYRELCRRFLVRPFDQPVFLASRPVN